MLQIVIERRGQCRRCGYCCEGCPHLVPKFEGPKPEFYKCNIYEKRNEFCPECGLNHHCDSDDPQFPIRHENPYCGYRFYEVKSGAEVIQIIQIDSEWFSKHGSK